MNEEKKIWLEKIQDRTGLCYPYIFIITTLATFCIYVLFSYRVTSLNLNDYYSLLPITATCILLGLEFFGIPYLISLVKKTLKEIPLKDPGNNMIFISFENLFYKRIYLFIVILLVELPFVINLFYYYQIGCSSQIVSPFFYCMEKTGWNLFLDVYNNAIGYFLEIYLLAILFWLCVTLFFTIREIADAHQKLIKIDPLKIDKIGGLDPIRDVINRVIFIYFICILLVLLQYVGPFNFINYQSIEFVILLGIGLLLFITALSAIKKLNLAKNEDKILLLNEKISEYDQTLMDYISESDDTDDKTVKDNLLYTKNKLDILYEERERLLKLNEETKGYDAKTIIIFLSAFIPALVTFLDVTIDLGQKIIMLFGLK